MSKITISDLIDKGKVRVKLRGAEGLETSERFLEFHCQIRPVLERTQPKLMEQESYEHVKKEVEAEEGVQYFRLDSSGEREMVLQEKLDKLQNLNEQEYKLNKIVHSSDEEQEEDLENTMGIDVPDPSPSPDSDTIEVPTAFLQTSSAPRDEGVIVVDKSAASVSPPVPVVHTDKIFSEDMKERYSPVSCPANTSQDQQQVDGGGDRSESAPAKVSGASVRPSPISVGVCEEEIANKTVEEDVRGGSCPVGKVTESGAVDVRGESAPSKILVNKSDTVGNGNGDTDGRSKSCPAYGVQDGVGEDRNTSSCPPDVSGGCEQELEAQSTEEDHAQAEQTQALVEIRDRQQVEAAEEIAQANPVRDTQRKSCPVDGIGEDRDTSSCPPDVSGGCEQESEAQPTEEDETQQAQALVEMRDRQQLETAEAIAQAKLVRDTQRQEELKEFWKHDSLISLRIEYLEPPEMSISQNLLQERDASPEFSTEEINSYTKSKYQDPIQIILITNDKVRPGPSARSKWCIRKVPDVLSCHLQDFVGLPETIKKTIINLHQLTMFDIDKISEIVELDVAVVTAVLEEDSLPKHACFEELLCAPIPRHSNSVKIEVRSAQDVVIDILKIDASEGLTIPDSFVTCENGTRLRVWAAFLPLGDVIANHQ
eukprot:gene929-285_t